MVTSELLFKGKYEHVLNDFGERSDSRITDIFKLLSLNLRPPTLDRNMTMIKRSIRLISASAITKLVRERVNVTHPEMCNYFLLVRTRVLKQIRRRKQW